MTQNGNLLVNSLSKFSIKRSDRGLEGELFSNVKIQSPKKVKFSRRSSHLGTGCFNTGRIQCEVLTTLPFWFSWIKKFLGQQSKICVDNSVEKLFR